MPRKIKKEKKVVVVSGGFDPLHVGHVRMFKEAKTLGDKLIIVLNNDNWLKKKKGFVFMSEEERKELLSHIKWIDEIVLSNHTADTEDISVCSELRIIKPHIFAKGGDRTIDNIPEVALCNELGIEMVFNVGFGGKVQSSSWLLEKHVSNIKRKKSKKSNGK
ncbi:MAG: adenylyltransferase/cytidyltransferase family protein [Patescibacteria group bacterium]